MDVQVSGAEAINLKISLQEKHTYPCPPVPDHGPQSTSREPHVLNYSCLHVKKTVNTTPISVDHIYMMDFGR